MTIDQRELRDVLGCFATGVTIITGREPDGRPTGLTANSFSSVSLDPPLVLFSLDRGANCAAAFDVGRPFTVNVLSEAQQEHSNLFASKAEDKFAAGGGWSEGGNGCARLEAALAHLECTCDSLHDGGDHWIIVGRVDRAEGRADGSPLLYFRGRYAAIDGAG
jgi:flavin reductase (DIM6/NTAB) family NADH-FMN oxidoreductase RutF